MSLVREEKLIFWANNGLNVLFSGAHGVGKTAMVKSTFAKMNFNWRYFSASTMDVWTDLVGVPKEKINPVTQVSYLDLVRPEDFANDTVNALFFDEFNRAPKKVRNAVLELIQFKSINGKPFNNLKLIWAAINPYDEDETYDVEKLDPAQLDRFHIQVDVPYQPDSKFFRDKYGERGSTAVSWWNKLSAKDQKEVTPRRLDYIVNHFNIGGDVRDMMPKSINADQLITQFNTGAFGKRLKELFTNGDKDTARQELSQENFFNGVVPEIIKKDEYITFFFDVMPEEKLANLLSTDHKFRQKVLATVQKSPVLKSVADNIIETNGAKKGVVTQLKQWTSTNYTSATTSVAMELNTKINAAFKNGDFDNTFKKLGLLREINDHMHVWYGSADVRENVCRTVCETIIRSQESTLKFKGVDAVINRIIYAIGRETFVHYYAGREKHFRQKYNNKADKVLKYLNETYSETGVSETDRVFVENLQQKVAETAKVEADDNETVIVQTPTTTQKPKRRGRPKKTKSVIGINSQDLQDKINDLLSTKKDWGTPPAIIQPLKPQDLGIDRPKVVTVPEWDDNAWKKWDNGFLK